MRFLGERLKEQRKKTGYTLEALAKLTDSSKSYMWELESGKQLEPSGKKVLMLSRALGQPMEWFYGEESHADHKIDRLEKAVRLLARWALNGATDRFNQEIVLKLLEPEGAEESNDQL